MLTDGARDLPRASRRCASDDWSYNPLDAGEKAVRAVGCIRGGFTAEAAEAICNTGQDLPMEATDGLTSLLNKSTLQQPRA
jgi:hypothetical protein